MFGATSLRRDYTRSFYGKNPRSERQQFQSITGKCCHHPFVTEAVDDRLVKICAMLTLATD